MPWNAVGISRSKVVFSWNVIVGWAQSRAKEKNIIIDFFTSTCFVQHSARESADLIPTTWPTFRPDIGAMKKHEGWSKIVEYHEKFDCGSILLNEGKNVMRKNGMGSTRIFLPTRMVKFYIREPIRTFPPTYSQKKNMCFLVRVFPSNTYPRRHSKKWHECLHQLLAEIWQIFTSVVGWFLFRSKWNDFTFRWKLILPVVLTIHLQNSFGKPSERFRGFRRTYIAVKETLTEESWKLNYWKAQEFLFSKQIGCNCSQVLILDFKETTVVQQWCSLF